ncbi:MAG: alpha/beta fold hydrolase [Egibacteraceae bacterium]
MSSRTLEKAAFASLASALAGVAGVLYASSRSWPGIPDAAAPMPPYALPPARLVPVPERGEIFVREAPWVGDEAGPQRPVIVLIHGWMFPADLTWFACYQPIAQIGPIVAMDLRGHGRGSRPCEPFRLADAADDIAALLRELGTGPAVAVGYSMGGTIAQLLWRRNPDVVRGLVLCATAATFSEHLGDRLLWRGMGAFQVALRLVPRFWWQRLGRSYLPEASPSLLPWMIGELDRGSAEDVAEAGRELGRYDARDWLGGVDVPTAVVVTAKDRLVPAARQRALASLIAGAQTYEVPLGHDACTAHADLFVAAVGKAIEHVLDV